MLLICDKPNNVSTCFLISFFQSCPFLNSESREASVTVLGLESTLPILLRASFMVGYRQV